SGYHRLKEGAVPTVFQSSTPRATRVTKQKLLKVERDSPRPPRATRRWRQDPPPDPSPDPSFPSNLSCFPAEGKEDPSAPPAGDHGGLPALPGPSGARGPPQDNLLVVVTTTNEQENLLSSSSLHPEGDPQPPLSSHPRPVSPSLYMLRLPPPAGAYIQSEHSYQVGSALLWKR
ncbi:THAP7 protein, partial [Galbula dea]|nr:THAP7 protein [Galbula dea]